MTALPPNRPRHQPRQSSKADRPATGSRSRLRQKRTLRCKPQIGFPVALPKACARAPSLRVSGRWEALTKFEPHDLARTRSGNLIDEVDCGRYLVCRQMPSAMLKNDVGIATLDAGHHKKRWHFAQVGMRCTYHRTINNHLAPEYHFLNFSRRDILASSDN